MEHAPDHLTAKAMALHGRATSLDIEAARARRDGHHNLATVFERMARDARAQVAEIAAQFRREML